MIDGTHGQSPQSKSCIVGIKRCLWSVVGSPPPLPPRTDSRTLIGLEPGIVFFLICYNLKADTTSTNLGYFIIYQVIIDSKAYSIKTLKFGEISLLKIIYLHNY